MPQKQEQFHNLCLTVLGNWRFTAVFQHYVELITQTYHQTLRCRHAEQQQYHIVTRVTAVVEVAIE